VLALDGDDDEEEEEERGGRESIYVLEIDGDVHKDERVREQMAVVEINGECIMKWDVGRVRGVLCSGERPLTLGFR